MMRGEEGRLGIQEEAIDLSTLSFGRRGAQPQRWSAE